MGRLELILGQIRASRRYTEGLLAATDEADWFRTPPGAVSHVAWQVGHLAMAQYRLALERVRGRRAGDEALIPDRFLRSFGRGSVPEPDPSAYPSAGEIRGVFDRVHERAMSELVGLPDAALDEPPESPHRLCATRAEVLGWCARHEMFHAGQIALLRRMLGAPPLW